MIDNSSVVIAHGRGRDAVAAPAMQALAQRFDFRFEAHAVGHADRSGRVERPFHYIENNFYPGRSFFDLEDCNQQLREWCDTSNLKFRRHLGAAPRTLWVGEKPALKALPSHIPEIYDVHERRVDVEGYVTLHTNRYSVPNPEVMIGRRLRLRETLSRVLVLEGRDELCSHEKLPPSARQRATRPEHRVVCRRRGPREPSPEEKDLRAQHELFGRLIDRLRERHGGRAIRTTRRLYQLFQDYPTHPLIEGIQDALAYDLIDLTRIEQMVLKKIAGDYFKLPQERENERRPGPAPRAAQTPENPRDPESGTEERGDQ